MRIGVLSAVPEVCAAISPSSPDYVTYGCGPSPVGTVSIPGYIGPAPVAPVGQSPGPTGTTYGVNAAGDSVICPPGYPFDETIKDCKGYVGSPADVAASQLQASIDICQSGGGTWDMGNGVCVPVPVIDATQLIPGVPNWALYTVGGFLGYMLLMNTMGGRR